MQFKTIIVAALATVATAEHHAAPYKLAKKSVSLVQLAARQEPGYQPEQTYCGEGDTCEEACGSGFDVCASEDDLTHCYDKGAGETCCQDDNGNACEAGYYCAGAADNSGDTWCCPDNMSTEECATEYSVDGGLVSQTPAAPTGTGSLASPTNGTAVTGGSNGPTATSDPDIVDVSAADVLAGSSIMAAVVALAAAVL